jgi:predicted house-cleaning noncanonical NTP pyrophosphatase (MazG superfamily)
MVGFILNKLVRDRLPHKFREQKIKYLLKQLTNREFEQHILNKIREEADEFRDSTSRVEKATEAADLLEAIDSACLWYGFNLEDLHNQEGPSDSSFDELYKLISDFSTDRTKAGLLIQVVYTLAYPITREEINERRLFKEKRDGLLRKRVYMTEIDVPDDSPWLDGFKAYPDKYPPCTFIGEGDFIDCFDGPKE